MRASRGDEWWMFFTARVAGIAEPNAGGAIGFATSRDLLHWTLRAPVFIGGFGQLEVPQVFLQRGHWYCLFCTGAEHWSMAQAAVSSPVSGTHYLIADDPLGTWRIAPGKCSCGSKTSPFRSAVRIASASARCAASMCRLSSSLSRNSSVDAS